MKTTITPGQIIKTRSLCDYDCIYTIEILSRSENGFAMVKLEDQEKPVRRKIYTRDDGREYIMAFGRYSMAPAFYAPEPEPVEKCGYCKTDLAVIDAETLICPNCEFTPMGEGPCEICGLIEGCHSSGCPNDPEGEERFFCECGSLIVSEGYIGCTAEKCGQAPAESFETKVANEAPELLDLLGVVIKNDESKAGQLAGKKEFFGTEGSSDFRFAVYPVHTRFGSVSWFVADAEKPDEDGKAMVIRQETSRDRAIASININGGK